MCGIVGAFSTSRIDVDRFNQACQAIRHRGPDDHGVETWADHQMSLGHERLSIIDLSPAGHNPMANEDGSVWIVFNGEIYNFRELRRELEGYGHVFRSQTDTEVIIHAYEQWGDDHVHHLRGMFAYALYDRRGRDLDESQWSSRNFRLLLVRDRLGIKPLFYYQDNSVFIFSSEIKSILAWKDIDRSLDRSALFDYLTYLYIPAPKTAYLRIRKLPAGHLLSFDGRHTAVRQYWDVPVDSGYQNISVDDAVQEVREVLAEAVQLHMISDVPVGIFLSGGMDSSTITALAARNNSQPMLTYSIGFDIADHSETHYAKIVADYLGTDHRELIVDSDAVQELLPRIVGMYDEPYADGSAIPTYLVSKLAGREVKVVLSGDGGDEVFAGYSWYGRWFQRQRLNKVPSSIRYGMLGPLGRAWPSQARGGKFKRLLEDFAYPPLEQYARQLELFSPVEKRRILRSDWASEFSDYDDYWYFRQHWRPELGPITRLQYLDLKTYLPDDILTKVDRASMAVSLEVRPPLLDHKVVETVFRIPAAVRFHEAEPKYLLKRATADLLPATILNRPKKGFSSPLIPWLQAEYQWAEDFLSDTPCYVTRDALQRIGRYAWGAKIWALLVLEQWARTQ